MLSNKGSYQVLICRIRLNFLTRVATRMEVEASVLREVMGEIEERVAVERTKVKRNFVLCASVICGCVHVCQCLHASVYIHVHEHLFIHNGILLQL